MACTVRRISASFHRQIRISRGARGVNLSPRQKQVADLLATGMSNKQIARKIGLAEGTVKFHVMRIFERVGARNRTEAALTLRGAQQ